MFSRFSELYFGIMVARCFAPNTRDMQKLRAVANSSSNSLRAKLARKYLGVSTPAKAVQVSTQKASTVTVTCNGCTVSITIK
jgi:hypothetical protein